MILRPALPQDAPALAELGRVSFVAAFGHLYPPQDLASFLEDVHSVSAVAGEIANPAITYRLAADAASGALAGYIKLKQPSPFGDYSDAARPLCLAQLYSAPARTGQGIGAQLIEWAIAEARLRGCDAMQLSVWSENTGAQRFYQRYGFGYVADIDFWVGNTRDDEFLYELRL
ncbi:MAG: N-acetyltransferase family protein [Erythrobacter sp.]